MDYSEETLLAGEAAGDFAKMMGFEQTSLNTNHSESIYQAWIAADCQPNYYRNVYNQSTSCPPYKPMSVEDASFVSAKDRNYEKRSERIPKIWRENHDTIGMIA